MNNKMILAAGISLLSMNVLNGEITGEHTMWSGTHLNYEGVSIINKPALPQKGVEAKKGVKNAYNIMPGKVTVITSLNKNPQEKQEWLYKKIHEVRISMTGNIYVALIFADTKNDVPFAYDPNKFGTSGTLYSQVYITALHKVTKMENKSDFGTSGKDEDPTFTLVKKI